MSSRFSERRRAPTTCRLAGLLLRRRRLEALPFPLLHELVVFRGAGPRRRVRRQAAGPCRDGIANSGRELLVDGSASAQAARQECDGQDGGKLASTDRHLRKSQPVTGKSDGRIGQPTIFPRGASLPLNGLDWLIRRHERYFNTSMVPVGGFDLTREGLVTNRKPTMAMANAPIVEIDIAAGFRRHAAPI